MKRCFLILAVLLLAVPSARAQDLITRDPGYVDLSEVETWFSAEPRIEVNLKGSLMRMVAQASRSEDPELYAMLSKLKGIFVRSYALPPGQASAIDRHSATLGRRLEGRGWETVATVREDGEHVRMYMKPNGEGVAGMMVMVVDQDERETVFVNIVGQIDPEDIGRLGDKFNIDAISGR